jgi:hypothetical protein
MVLPSRLSFRAVLPGGSNEGGSHRETDTIKQMSDKVSSGIGASSALRSIIFPTVERYD